MRSFLRPASRIGLTLSGAGAAMALWGCGHDSSPAGSKQIGVGLEPGQIQSTPEPRGGLIDYALVDLRGRWLDFGSTITGLYGAGDAFTSAEDPFHAVFGFSYVFTPALTAADEVSLVSPKGPDAIDTCFPLINNVGPLGSFTTVDLGDGMQIRDRASAGKRTRFTLDRNPLDYPERTSDVFIYYIGAQPWLAREYIDADPLGWAQEHLASNWAFDEEMELYFGGGIPPENAPVASIPLPSDVIDERAGKTTAESPRITTPSELDGLVVSTSEDGSGAVPVEFDAESPGLPSPWDGTSGALLNVGWVALDEDGGGQVTVAVRLLGSVPDGTTVPCPDDPGRQCGCTIETDGSGAPVLDLYGNAVDDCDPEYAALAAAGIDDGHEGFGATATDPMDCANGLDDDGDGGCDSTGCYGSLGEWLPPDIECPRLYPISQCDPEALTCQPTGGSRDTDGFVGELVCTAADDGSFTIGADDLESLEARVDMSRVRGAILVVSRTREDLVQLPLVRNETGGAADINPVRLRASHMVVGRLAYQP